MIAHPSQRALRARSRPALLGVGAAVGRGEHESRRVAAHQRHAADEQARPEPPAGRAAPGTTRSAARDPTYSCDGASRGSTCVGQPHKCRFHGTCRDRVYVSSAARHNELLGGHGNDTIHAGPGRRDLGRLQAQGPADVAGRPPARRPGQGLHLRRPRLEHDHQRRRRRPHPRAFRPRIIRCSRRTIAYLSRRSIKRYKLRGCRRISFKTLGY